MSTDEAPTIYKDGKFIYKGTEIPPERFASSYLDEYVGDAVFVGKLLKEETLSFAHYLVYEITTKQVFPCFKEREDYAPEWREHVVGRICVSIDHPGRVFLGSETTVESIEKTIKDWVDNDFRVRVCRLVEEMLASKENK